MYNLLNNNNMYAIIPVAIILVSGYYIKSYFNSTVIETTPPPTFNVGGININAEITPKNSVTQGQIQEVHDSWVITPTNSVTNAEMQEVDDILNSGETTPRNSVELQEVDEILWQFQPEPQELNNGEITINIGQFPPAPQELNNGGIINVSQGQIQNIDPMLDIARTQSPYCLSRDECTAIIERLQRGERLSDFDQANLDLSIRNIEHLEQYADILDDAISARKEVLLQIADLIYNNLF